MNVVCCETAIRPEWRQSGTAARAQNVADDPKSILACVGDQRHGIFAITEAATCRSPWLSVENCHGVGRRHCEQMKSDMQDVKVENQNSHSGRRAIRTCVGCRAKPAWRERCDH